MRYINLRLTLLTYFTLSSFIHQLFVQTCSGHTVVMNFSLDAQKMWILVRLYLTHVTVVVVKHAHYVFHFFAYLTRETVLCFGAVLKLNCQDKLSDH